MSITTQPELPANPSLPGKPSLPHLLVRGFTLARRNGSFVVWAYAINLVFGLLAGVPFANGLAPFLDHSLAAQKIAGTLDLGYLSELAIQQRQTHLFPVVVQTAFWLNLLQLLLLFFLFAGTVFVYVSSEPPRFSVLLRGGVDYFWRFVRAAVLAGCCAGFILGLLLVLRAALLSRLAIFYFGRNLFLGTTITGAVIFLIALLLRLWFDLVEVYIVRNAMAGELRAHRALLPACGLLFRNFFRLFGNFLLAGLAGVSALALCLLLWKALPAGQVWAAFLLAQLGLFCLLAGRFWQRGLAAALVLAVDPPVIASEKIVEVVEEDAAPSLAGVAGVGGLSEPTLSELVLKLRSEPWATPPDAPPRQPLSPPPAEAENRVAATPVLPESETTPVSSEYPSAKRTQEPPLSPADRHAAKFPLGGVAPEGPPAPASPTETEMPASAPENPARPRKPSN